MRRSAGTGMALLALGALSVAPGGCSGREACGHGRYDPSDPRVRARRGPYCLSIAAEGVGSVNVQVNPGLGPAGAGGEEGGVGELPPTSGGAFAYTQATPAGQPWVDICSQAGSRRMLVHVDDQYDSLPGPGGPLIPFPVRFYDTPVAPPFTVSSNGWMSFMSGPGPLVGNIPDPTSPNLTIAPYWHDLYTRSTGVCAGVTGSAPNRSLVVQWEDLHFCCTDDPSVHLTFEVIVHEARPPRLNNVIDVLYQRMDGANSRDVHGGVENATGTAGSPIQPPWTAPRGVRFVPSR